MVAGTGDAVIGARRVAASATARPGGPAETVAPETVDDADRDALHILPLAILPIQTQALKRARLIKNSHLESVVEMFHDATSGSGQVAIENLARELDWPVGTHPDLVLLNKLALLPSFDVFSLRVSLREIGVEVSNVDALRLSPGKVAELTQYMSRFTRPLIQQIYGCTDLSIQTFDDILDLFRKPNVADARAKLRQMAERLGISLGEIPRFLEDYGDILLSLSYYRSSLDAIVRPTEQFLASLNVIRHNHQLCRDPALLKTCDAIETTINGLMASVTGRIESFERSTADIWQDLTAERFRKVTALVREHHTAVGAILCVLSVKIDAWQSRFPNGVTSPVKNAQFLMLEMRQGLEACRALEDAAPILGELN